MTDWSKTMKQTFEYYIVDPLSWKEMRKIENVISSKITRDLETDTLGSLTLNTSEVLNECYVRVYMITIQNGIREKHPMGTFLVQTPSLGYDGKIKNISLDAYSPLLEMKENQPPLGYSLMEGDNIMKTAYRLIRENCRAPVVEVEDDSNLYFDFIANTNDTWVTFIKDLVSNAKFSLGLDELSRIIFTPVQEVDTLQPKWKFDDNNSSILHPNIELTQDLYGIPNAVEVILSNNREFKYAKVVNDDEDSPTSTVNRGREIVHRVVNPALYVNPTEEMLAEHGKQVLRELSCLEYRLTYTHGYCPVGLGDCVRLNYTRAGLTNVKAKIIKQTIDCIPGCPVTETAIFTSQLWR